jgi:hypothetical protein
MSEMIDDDYSPRGRGDKKWTSEYRKAWNKEYREKIKSGEIKPMKRVTDSKWQDREFRRAYDEARKKRINEKKTVEKIESPPEKRPNYTKAEKEIIMTEMIKKIRAGETPYHPHFELALATKKEAIRNYPSKKK